KDSAPGPYHTTHSTADRHRRLLSGTIIAMPSPRPRRLACLALILLMDPRSAAPAPAPEKLPGAGQARGITPPDAQGKPLNLDFETGTLKDWTAEGDAFAGQPVEGDTVAARRPDMKSRHEGRYWIGGYERQRDRPHGTLTSRPFLVTQPFARF